MTDALQVLVVDDHPLFRDGVRALPGSVTDMEVAGEATTGDEAIMLAEHGQPDVILMDIKMPGVNGIEATRRILQTSPHIGVLIVTMFEGDDSVFAAMRAGALGYLLRGADQKDIPRAIRAVGDGEAIFGPSIARRLIQFFSSHGARRRPSPTLPTENGRS